MKREEFVVGQIVYLKTVSQRHMTWEQIAMRPY